MPNKKILTRCPNWPHGCKAVFTGTEMNRNEMQKHAKVCKYDEAREPKKGPRKR